MWLTLSCGTQSCTESPQISRGVPRTLLHGEFDFNATRVRLGPHEIRIHQLDLVNALDLFQTQRQQLPRLELALHPRRAQILAAPAAPKQSDLVRTRTR